MGVAESLSPGPTATTCSDGLPEAPKRGVVGPDVSEAVYVCLEEAGPMFGHLYGLGSFLASPRGTMVASAFEVLSSVAHEREKQREQIWCL